MPGPADFVSKSDRVSKTYLLEVYHQTMHVLHESILHIEDEDQQLHLLETHDDLFALLSDKLSLEEGLNTYRQFVIDVLSAQTDETHKIYSIMIQKLVPLVTR